MFLTVKSKVETDVYGLRGESFAVPHVGFYHFGVISETGRTDKHEAKLLANSVVRVLFYLEVGRVLRFVATFCRLLFSFCWLLLCDFHLISLL